MDKKQQTLIHFFTDSLEKYLLYVHPLKTDAVSKKKSNAYGLLF
jgi:hypothetical protein